MKKQRRELSEAIGCLLKVRQNHCRIPCPHCLPNCLRDLAKETFGSITLLRSDQTMSHNTIAREDIALSLSVYGADMMLMISNLSLERDTHRAVTFHCHNHKSVLSLCLGISQQ